MPPTVCVTEFPIAGTTVRRRQNHRNSVNGVQRRTTFALEQMLLRSMSVVEMPVISRGSCLRETERTNMVPNCSIPDKSRKHLTNTGEQYRKLVSTKEDLLSIVIRTIILVRRNHILQRRLNALRAETRRFLRSVLNNPENRCQQERWQAPMYSENEIVSSSTQEDVLTTLSPLFGHDLTRNSFHGIISSTCDSSDHTNDESSSSDNSEDSSRSEC